MPTYILPFSSPETTLPRVGGKGANLAELARGGWRVPPGYIVTTEAYGEFVASHDLQPRILELLAGYSGPDALAALDTLSARLRELFETNPMPYALAGAILAAYHASALAEVAVRSSATAEDLPGLAFAGQQETYLNVLGERALLDAVKKCWGSLWTARAIAYRNRNNISSENVALAVVVQKMVPSEASGVLFTANPVSGRRDETIIDASFGLGEAIVSGQVEPDHYVVRAPDWRITERDLGAKALAIVPAAGGGTSQVTRDAAQLPALTDEQMVELARMGAEVAAHFASPQDIEWALAGGELYLLQSRPITSLYPVPPNPFPDPGLRIYASVNSIQGVAGPLTPLGAEALREFVFCGLIQLLGLTGNARDYVPRVGGRLFADVTDLARDPRLRNVLKGLFARADPGALASLQRLEQQGRVPVYTVLTRREMLHLLPRVAPILRGLAGALRAPERAAQRVNAELAAVVTVTRAELEHAHDLAGRLQSLHTNLPRVFARVLSAAIPAIGPMMAGLSFVDRWLVSWLGEEPGTALKLMRGLPNNVTTQMDLRLWQVAQSIRANGQTDTARALAPFLDKYGMRAVGEIDFGRPRWRDDPTPVLSTLAGYLRLDDPQLAPDVVFERGRAASEALAAELVARVRKTRFGAWRARLLAAAIRRMRVLGGLRELPKFSMIQVLDLYRAAFLDSARELVSRGVLAAPEDIFFVPLDALEQYAAGQPLDLQAIVASERTAYEREQMRRQLPRLLLSTGEAFYEGVSETGTGANELTGEPVSPGTVEGRVQVVLDPSAAQLEPGAILVCHATDPGWTPLFLTAGGLVMEIGGVVTHGSVVAREYGIPAVVGIQNATTRLQTGQRVRVDGNMGKVTILSAEGRG